MFYFKFQPDIVLFFFFGREESLLSADQHTALLCRQIDIR